MKRPTDAIVIGGGVIGMTIAWRLAQAGVTVRLLEWGACGRQASWAALGALCPGSPHFHHAMANLQRENLSVYPAFCEELKEATGIDPEYVRSGRVEFCDDDQRYRMGLSEVEALRSSSMPDGSPLLEMLTPEQAVEREPAIRPPDFGALLCHRSAQVRNPRLLQALYRACEEAGVDIREYTPAMRLVWRHDRVTGVATEGEEIPAEWVVLAAGAWSSAIDHRIAETVQISPVRGQALLLEMDDPPFDRIIRKKKIYVLRRRDSLILVGSTVEEDAGFETRNTAAGVNGLIEGALDLVPGLEKARMLGAWSGLRPKARDWRPDLGFVPGVDGMIAACGHFKTGLIFAPLTASIVAELVTTGSTTYDISQAAPGRPVGPPRRRKT